MVKKIKNFVLTGLSLRLAPPASCGGTLRKPGLPATSLKIIYKLYTPQPLYNTIVGVQIINRVS